MKIAILVLILAIALVLAWNLIPSFRDRMRGYTTVAENLLAGGLYYAGIINDSIADLKSAGWLPENVERYLLGALIVYNIVKRWQTATPLGGDKK